MKSFAIFVSICLLMSFVYSENPNERSLGLISGLKDKIKSFWAKIKMKFQKPEVLMGEVVEKPEVVETSVKDWK